MNCLLSVHDDINIETEFRNFYNHNDIVTILKKVLISLKIRVLINLGFLNSHAVAFDASCVVVMLSRTMCGILRSVYKLRPTYV